jgi:hypothetical protein
VAGANRVGGGIAGVKPVYDRGDFLHGSRYRDSADDGERARRKGPFCARYPPHIQARIVGRGCDHDTDLVGPVAGGDGVADAWPASRACVQSTKLCAGLYVVDPAIFVADYRT